MSFDLEGQRFVITGAGRGIGNAIGKRFACLGARVSGWDLNVSEIIENPAFSSQTKDTLTTKVAKFGSSYKPTDVFIKKISKCKGK